MSNNEKRAPVTRNQIEQAAKRRNTEIDDSFPPGAGPLSLEDLAMLIMNSKGDLQKDIGGINNRIEDLQQLVDSLKINDVAAQCPVVSQKVDNIEDELHRLKQQNELRIAGIPFTDGEDLTIIFKRIVSKLEYDVSNPIMMPILIRIDNNKSQTVRPVIIAQFLCNPAKVIFFGIYLKNLSLSL